MEKLTLLASRTLNFLCTFLNVFEFLFQTCVKRQCDDSEIKYFEPNKDERAVRKRQKSAKIFFNADNKITTVKNKTFYKSVEVNGIEYKVGNFIKSYPFDPETKPVIGKIINIFTNRKRKNAHIRWFDHGEDTILGNVADSKEILLYMIVNVLSFTILYKKSTLFTGKVLKTGPKLEVCTLS